MRSALDLIDAAVASKASAADISAQLANLIGSAPAALDTLAELATALNNDPSFAAHTATSIASLQSAVATLQAGMSTYYTRQKWTLTAGQTSINTSGYMVGFVQLYLNGVLLVDGDDYTATDGTLITLAVGGAAGDSVEAIMLHPFQLVNTTFTGKTTIEGQLDMPQWTTATRPANPRYGTTGYNTTTKALENYTDQGWLKVSVPIPIITSSSGNIYSGVTSTITLTGINFGTSAATVTFTSGATSATATATPANGGQTCAVTVPAAIYGLAAGTAVTISLKNADNASSAALTLTSIGIPTGGTITDAGGYRYHTFTSSGSLIVPAGFALSVGYLIVAGGGGGGYDIGGGGGAGGLLNGTSAISQGTYSVTVGSGGAGSTVSQAKGGSGNNSSVFSVSAIGGGGGGSWQNPNGQDGLPGGSGGGAGAGYAGNAVANGGAGTSGQGYAGGNCGGSSEGYYIGGGGGGAGAAGASGGAGAGGGIGLNYSAWATATNTGHSGYYAGGGGGNDNSGLTQGPGGTGGGSSSRSTNAMANTGGGGHGGGYTGAESGTNGGSGIVIIRYQIT